MYKAECLYVNMFVKLGSLTVYLHHIHYIF